MATKRTRTDQLCEAKRAQRMRQRAAGLTHCPRETISSNALGAIAKDTLDLAREVRADIYGIRTFARLDDAIVKFEIVREARIALTAAPVPGLPVASIDRPSAFAEKFPANADRGSDESTLSRDIVDLAFMIDGWDAKDARAGLVRATEAYGAEVERKLDGVIRKLREDKPFFAHCIKALASDDRKRLDAGLRALAAKRWRKG